MNAEDTYSRLNERVTFLVICERMTWLTASVWPELLWPKYIWVKQARSLITNGNFLIFSPAASPDLVLYDASGHQTVASKIEKKNKTCLRLTGSPARPLCDVQVRTKKLVEWELCQSWWIYGKKKRRENNQSVQWSSVTEFGLEPGQTAKDKEKEREKERERQRAKAWAHLRCLGLNVKILNIEKNVGSP